jgi:hypothetical protein
MDFLSIVNTMERNRKLASASSYPFLIEDEGEIIFVWFYYDARQVGEDGAEIEIEEVCIYKNDKMLVSDHANIVIEDKFTAFEEPEVDEDEYMVQLEDIYHQYSRESMFDLLSKSVVAPIFKAYEAAEDFLKSEK